MNTLDTGAALQKDRLIVWGMAAILGVLGWFFFQSVLRALVQEWHEHENFSYGFLIPIIFGYLVWDCREVFKHPLACPSAWGAMTFLGALLLGGLGRMLGEPFVSRVSFVIAVIGIFQLLWGSYVVKKLAFPLCYLFLMVPPPYVIVKAVSFHLRMFDATVSTRLVQAVGVPVYQDAHLMHLPDITLEVADVCSGIASLFAMIALGTIYVYYLPAKIGAKMLVMAGAIVCPLIANLIRLFLVTVSVYLWGPVMLGAFYHTFTGTFTFVLSLGMFLWLGEMARRKYPQATAQPNVVTFSQPREGMKGIRGRWATAVLLAASVGGGLVYAFNRPALPTGRNPLVDLERIPTTLGTYTLAPEKPANPYSDRRADQSLSRLYISENFQVELFVGFSSRQQDENRLQSPKLVFPKNWEYAAMENVQVPLGAGRRIDAIGLLTKKNEDRQYVLFWYQVHGAAFASDFRNRIELMKNSLLRGRSDGGVIRIAASVARHEPVDQVRSRLVGFATQLHPELARTLPN